MSLSKRDGSSRSNGTVRILYPNATHEEQLSFLVELLIKSGVCKKDRSKYRTVGQFPSEKWVNKVVSGDGSAQDKLNKVGREFASSLARVFTGNKVDSTERNLFGFDRRLNALLQYPQLFEYFKCEIHHKGFSEYPKLLLEIRKLSGVANVELAKQSVVASQSETPAAAAAGAPNPEPIELESTETAKKQEEFNEQARKREHGEFTRTLSGAKRDAEILHEYIDRVAAVYRSTEFTRSQEKFDVTARASEQGEFTRTMSQTQRQAKELEYTLVRADLALTHSVVVSQTVTPPAPNSESQSEQQCAAANVGGPSDEEKDEQHKRREADRLAAVRAAPTSAPATVATAASAELVAVTVKSSLESELALNDDSDLQYLFRVPNTMEQAKLRLPSAIAQNNIKYVSDILKKHPGIIRQNLPVSNMYSAKSLAMITLLLDHGDVLKSNWDTTVNRRIVNHGFDFIRQNIPVANDQIGRSGRDQFLDQIIQDMIDKKDCNWNKDTIDQVARSWKDQLHTRLMLRMKEISKEEQIRILEIAVDPEPKHALGKIFAVRRRFTSSFFCCFVSSTANGVLDKINDHLNDIDETRADRIAQQRMKACEALGLSGPSL